MCLVLPSRGPRKQQLIRWFAMVALPYRKDWLFIGKEALVSLVMARLARGGPRPFKKKTGLGAARNGLSFP